MVKVLEDNMVQAHPAVDNTDLEEQTFPALADNMAQADKDLVIN